MRIFIIFIFLFALLITSSSYAYDIGYLNMPRAEVDINGDGRHDFCRFVGSHPNIFLSCDIGDGNQFGFNSVLGIDSGYPDRKYQFTDINIDGKADYCRCVGNDPKTFYSCNLARDTGFDKNQFTLTIHGVDCSVTRPPLFKWDNIGYYQRSLHWENPSWVTINLDGTWEFYASRVANYRRYSGPIDTGNRFIYEGYFSFYSGPFDINKNSCTGQKLRWKYVNNKMIDVLRIQFASEGYKGDTRNVRKYGGISFNLVALLARARCATFQPGWS